MSATASLRVGDAGGRRLTDAGDYRRSDLVLLGLLSIALHAWVWQIAVRQSPPPDVEAKPLPIEIQLVAPPAPKPVAPPPPPQVVPQPPPPKPAPPPPPKPKPKPKPKPVPKPKPRPAPEPPPPAPVPPPQAAPAPPAPPVSTAPSAPASPGPVAPAADVPIVPAHTRATSKRNPKPEYPTIARRRGWQGQVLLRIRVGADGLPGKVEVAESSGREVLDQSALRTVRRWTFTPAMRGDEPVESTLTLSIVFKLD